MIIKINVALKNVELKIQIIKLIIITWENKSCSSWYEDFKIKTSSPLN